MGDRPGAWEGFTAPRGQWAPCQTGSGWADLGALGGGSSIGSPSMNPCAHAFRVFVALGSPLGFRENLGISAEHCF